MTQDHNSDDRSERATRIAMRRFLRAIAKPDGRIHFFPAHDGAPDNAFYVPNDLYELFAPPEASSAAAIER